MIIRIKKENNYAIIPNEILRNTKLSWQAKGLLCYLLSLPNNYQIYTTELQKHSANGKDSTRATFQELLDIGYVEKLKPLGFSKGFNYNVYEKIHIAENQKDEIVKHHNAGFHISENPKYENAGFPQHGEILHNAGFHVSENPQLINTSINIINNSSNINKNINSINKDINNNINKDKNNNIIEKLKIIFSPTYKNNTYPRDDEDYLKKLNFLAEKLGEDRFLRRIKQVAEFYHKNDKTMKNSFEDCNQWGRLTRSYTLCKHYVDFLEKEIKNIRLAHIGTDCKTWSNWFVPWILKQNGLDLSKCEK